MKIRFSLRDLLWVTLPLCLLILFAVLPVLELRYTVYSFLAIPLWSTIKQLGWVYTDKPMFLTHTAAIFTAVVWSLPLFALLCVFRFWIARRGYSR